MTVLLLVATLISQPPPLQPERHTVTADPRIETVRPYKAKLLRMARCESGGRWWIFNPPYSGGLQFDLPTWRSAGGNGYPHLNSRLEQMFRAVKVIRRRGYAPWPVCGAA